MSPPASTIIRANPATCSVYTATVTLVGYASTTKKDELRVERIIVGAKTVELR